MKNCHHHGVLSIVLGLVLIQPAQFSPTDYWSDHFDEGANCKETELINHELRDNKQCADVQTGSNTQDAFVECKVRLHRNLLTKCAETKIRTPGRLLYCKKRSITECCFHNHTCVDSREQVNKEYGLVSIAYMKDKTKFLAELEQLGYKKCHPIDGYDASRCAADCKEAETEEFAKNCTSKGGFFKCCIRRDKQECHQCRFCCSLPLCAMNTSQGVLNHGPAVLAEHDQDNHISATDIYNVRRRMYKARDYRCLKPNDTQAPSEWAHYEHQGMKAAASKEELDKVDEIPFDINFQNFEDPDVLERFTGPDYKKYWKQVYGFDFVSKQEGNKVVKDNETVLEQEIMRALSEHCVEAEFRNFGRKCKKKRGLFKCCAFKHTLTVFERAHVELAKQNLIEKPQKLQCGEDNQSPQCIILTATHTCTVKDQISGKISTEFASPTLPHFKVGGHPSFDLEWSGFRTDFCHILDTCQDKPINFNRDLYELAYNKQTLCEALQESLKAANTTWLTKEAKELTSNQCKKQKLSSLILCEKESLLQSERAKNTTKAIRKMLKKLAIKRLKESRLRAKKKKNKRMVKKIRKENKETKEKRKKKEEDNKTFI